MQACIDDTVCPFDNIIVYEKKKENDKNTKIGKNVKKSKRISFHEMKEYGMILQMNWKKMTDNGGTYEKIRFKSTDVWNLFDRI